MGGQLGGRKGVWALKFMLQFDGGGSKSIWLRPTQSDVSTTFSLLYAKLKVYSASNLKDLRTTCLLISPLVLLERAKRRIQDLLPSVLGLRVAVALLMTVVSVSRTA